MTSSQARRCPICAASHGYRTRSIIGAHRNLRLYSRNASVNAVTAFLSIPASASRVDNNKLVFPLPIQEIQTNPILTQNPGYL